MTFTQYTKITLEATKGKVSVRLSPLSLFLSLHFIKCLQYNIRYLPISKTLILKLELDYNGLKTLAENHQKQQQKNSLRGSAPKPSMGAY